MDIRTKIPTSERISLTFIKDHCHIKKGQSVSYSYVNAMQFVANQRKLPLEQRIIDVDSLPKEALELVKEKTEVETKSKK